MWPFNQNLSAWCLFGRSIVAAAPRVVIYHKMMQPLRFCSHRAFIIAFIICIRFWSTLLHRFKCNPCGGFGKNKILRLLYHIVIAVFTIPFAVVCHFLDLGIGEVSLCPEDVALIDWHPICSSSKEDKLLNTVNIYPL